MGNVLYPPKRPHPSLGVGRAEVYAPNTGKYDYTFVQLIDVADTTEAPSLSSVEFEGTPVAMTVKLPLGALTLAGPANERTEIGFTKSR